MGKEELNSWRVCGGRSLSMAARRVSNVRAAGRAAAQCPASGRQAARHSVAPHICELVESVGDLVGHDDELDADGNFYEHVVQRLQARTMGRDCGRSERLALEDWSQLARRRQDTAAVPVPDARPTGGVVSRTLVSQLMSICWTRSETVPATLSTKHGHQRQPRPGRWMPLKLPNLRQGQGKAGDETGYMAAGG